MTHLYFTLNGNPSECCSLQEIMDDRTVEVEGIDNSSLRITVLENYSENPPHFKEFSENEFFNTTVCPNCRYIQRGEKSCTNCSYLCVYSSYTSSLSTLVHSEETHVTCDTIARAIPSNLIFDISMYFKTQPAAYQIANYNIHPKIELNYNLTSTADVVPEVVLVEHNLNIEIPNAFQSTFTYTIRQQINNVTFQGLKLKKIAYLKAELKTKHLKDHSFVIRVHVGTKVWESSTFTIVSSCRQLNPNIRCDVRPTKRPYSAQDDQTTAE